MGFGGGVGFGGAESSGCGSGVACLQISRLVSSYWGLLQSNGVPPKLGASFSCLAGTEMGAGGGWDVSWGLGNRDWASLAGRPVAQLLFQLV